LISARFAENSIFGVRRVAFLLLFFYLKNNIARQRKACFFFRTSSLKKINIPKHCHFFVGQYFMKRQCDSLREYASFFFQSGENFCALKCSVDLSSGGS